MNLISFVKLKMAEPIWPNQYGLPNYKNCDYFGGKLHTPVFQVAEHGTVVCLSIFTLTHVIPRTKPYKTGLFVKKIEFHDFFFKSLIYIYPAILNFYILITDL